MWKILVVFLLVIVNFGYWYWTTTPYHAVLEIRSSIIHHDLKTFEEYVDVDSVATKMIDGFLTPQVRAALGRGVLGELLGSGIVHLMKPTLVNIIKDEVVHFVENNDLEQRSRSALPDSRSALPDSRSALPDSRSALPDSRSALPDSRSALPDSRSALPDSRSADRSLTRMRSISGHYALHPARQADEQAASLRGRTLTAEYNQSSLYLDRRANTDCSSTSSPYVQVGFERFIPEAGDLKGFTSKLGFGRGAFKRIAFMRMQKDTAHIGLELYNRRYRASMLLELKMVKENDHWRLVEVSNFPSFIYMIIAYEQMRKHRS